MDNCVSQWGTAKLVPRRTSSKTARVNRTKRDTLRNAAAGSRAIKTPARANTARELKALARSMTTAWPTAKRQNREREGCEPTTATGNKTTEAALTTSVRRATRTKIAERFARKTLRNPIGSGTRFVKSRRSKKMLSQRQRAAAPLTTMESTRKKYSSGMVAVNGS